MRQVVFIESSASGAGHAAIMAAIELGIEPVLFATDSSRYNFSIAELKIMEVDTTSVDEIIKHTSQLPRLSGLGTTYEFYTLIAAQAASRLGLPCASPQAVAACRSKAETRKTLRHNAPHLSPDFRIIKNRIDAETAADELGLPLVLKVATQTGGAGIVKARSKVEAVSQANFLLSLDSYDNRALDGTVIAEAYLHGKEYSVETMHSRIIAITHKITGGPDHLTEIGHEIPAPLLPRDEDDIRQATEEALRALGITFGPTHTEVMLTKDGAKIVEVNARMGGGRIPLLIELVTGYPYARAFVAGLVGIPEPEWQVINRHAAVRFALLERSGTITGIEGVAKAKSFAHVVDAGTLALPGRKHSYAGNNRDRLGWAVAVAQSAEEARKAAVEGAGAISFILKDDFKQSGAA